MNSTSRRRAFLSDWPSKDCWVPARRAAVLRRRQRGGGARSRMRSSEARVIKRSSGDIKSKESLQSKRSDSKLRRASRFASFRFFGNGKTETGSMGIGVGRFAERFRAWSRSKMHGDWKGMLGVRDGNPLAMAFPREGLCGKGTPVPQEGDRGERGSSSSSIFPGAPRGLESPMVKRSSSGRDSFSTVTS